MIRSQRGQTLIMVAALLPLILGITGLAVDVGLLYHHKRRMQSAADAAALGGANEMWRNRTGTIVSLGRSQAAANGFTHAGTTVVNVYHPPVSGFYIGNNRYVEATITQPTPTWFMQLFGWTDVNVTARAVAGAGANGQHCIYALEESEPDGFRMDSSARVQANCGVTVNSTSSQALHTQSSAVMNATNVDVTGGYYRESSSSVTPAPNTGMLPDPDPLWYLDPPDASGACNQTNWMRDSGTHFLNPGVYCNGINLKSSAIGRLNTGIYIIRGGGIKIESNAQMISEPGGVMIYLTGTSTYPFKPLDFQSSGQVRLKAMTTGPYAGILFFADRTQSPSENHLVKSSVTTHFEGVLYFPRQMLTFESSTTTDAAYTMIIARKITMLSSAVLTVNANYGSLPGGSPLKKLTLVE